MRLIRKIYWLFISFVLAVIAQIYLFVGDIPTFQEIKSKHNSSDIVLISRNGEVLNQRRTDLSKRSFPWVTLGEISSHLTKSVVSQEDRRFYSHYGIDLFAFGRILKRVFSGEKLQGAGTITMQLYRIINKGKLSQSRYYRKYQEMLGALGLEFYWNKREILEAYLNTVPFRGELIGVGAASNRLFARTPESLNKYEGLILASLLRSPNQKLENIGVNVCSKLQEEERGQCLESLNAISTASLLIERKSDSLPGYLDAVLKSGDKVRNAGKIRTSINFKLQEQALQIARSRIAQIHGQNANDAAVVVLENQSGEVLAWVGNVGEGSTAQYVDGVLSRRSAGSTLKPFLYALAFEMNLIEPDTLIDDSPLNIQLNKGSYRPLNYDRKFRGAVPASLALGSSLNVPAVRVLRLVGLDRFFEILKLLGFNLKNTAESYGYSMALGSPTVTLLELTNAYRVFAQKGSFSSPILSLDPGLKRSDIQIFSEKSVQFIRDILSDRDNRSETFGLESPLSTSFWSAVKTGTSRDMVDNWCVGISDKFTVGVWVGNLSGTPMHDVTGVSGAAPIWNGVMNLLPHGHNTKDINSNHVVHNKSLVSNPVTVATISYPTDGLILSIDLDAPIEAQKIKLKSSSREANLNWVVDKVVIGSLDQDPIWQLHSGKHLFQIATQDGVVLDSVTITVR